MTGRAGEAFLQIGLEALRPAMAAARILTIVMLTYFLSAGELAHVIAGSAQVAFAVAAGQASWADYAVRFVLPALLGNIVGGVLFVAVLNHMQVRGSPGPKDA